MQSTVKYHALDVQWFWSVVMFSSPFPAQEGSDAICLCHRGDRDTESSRGIRVMGQKKRQREFDRWVFDGHIKKYTTQAGLALCALQENREWVVADCAHRQGSCKLVVGS